MAFVLFFECGIFSQMTDVSAQVVDLYIYNENDLYAFAESVNSGKTYENMIISLEADIEVNSRFFDSDGNLLRDDMTEWTPIGTEKTPFKGNFDGNGHFVSGLFYKGDKGFVGFFGYAQNAQIRNLYIIDSYFYADSHAGAIAGYAGNNSVVTSCHNTATYIYTTGGRSGGLIGWTNHTDIFNCTNTGYCFSKRCSGGIVGDVYSNGKIYNCENRGKVEGNELVGAITGGSTSADIQNCLSVGEVNNGYLIAGGAGSRSIKNCFALKNDTFNSKIGGTAHIFKDESAVLDKEITIGEESYTKVVKALNAYGATINESVPMTPWSQYEGLPFLNRENMKTSFGSTVSGWSMDELEDAYENNLIPEVLIGENLTKPVTRSEFAAIAVKLYEAWEGKKVAADKKTPFNDINGDINKNDIIKAYSLGITDGTTNNTFEPDVLITREQLATMLCRTYKKKEWDNWTLDTDDSFTLNYSGVQKFADDSDISEYAKPSVYFMVKYDVIKGIGDNKFAPKNTTSAQEAISYATATREQAILISLRSFENLK